MDYNLSRFVFAHERDYAKALLEIKSGQKQSHWMWYIFPQLQGLGKSSTSEYYGIGSAAEAAAFYRHPVLGKNLTEISAALTELDSSDAVAVIGYPDNKKLKSSMTLFEAVIPDNDIFGKVLDKFFDGKRDSLTLEMLGNAKNTPSQYQEEESFNAKHAIKKLREKYPTGLHFVVGDTHGQYPTLSALMDIIEFDPDKDHVFFVGDYNAGGNPHNLLQYIGRYFQADFNKPGFHLVRGNHEWELAPWYKLQNLPDIIVVKRKEMSYYIAHAGMIRKIFDIIANDIAAAPENSVFAYKLADGTTAYDAPFRQIIWSITGVTYNPNSVKFEWPSEDELKRHNACIIHGHTPYGYLYNRGPGYGSINCPLKQQHIWFSEDLQSFNIDSNIKGIYFSDSYRGLSCLCLEVLEEIAASGNGHITVEGVQNMQQFFFSREYVPGDNETPTGNIDNVLNSVIDMKTIGIADNRSACFLTESGKSAE